MITVTENSKDTEIEICGMFEEEKNEMVTGSRKWRNSLVEMTFISTDTGLNRVKNYPKITIF